jgi:hypothetical protein
VLVSYEGVGEWAALPQLALGTGLALPLPRAPDPEAWFWQGMLV